MTTYEVRHVLDHGTVALEDCYGGDQAVVRGARICYQSQGDNAQRDARLIERIVRSRPIHNTVLEHAVLTFRVKCPLFVARQWLRARGWTFCERSLRYCLATPEWYTPADESQESIIFYRQHMADSFVLYRHLLESGWRPERARAVLGTGIYTEFLGTVNVYQLMRWLERRLDLAAQYEHRLYAIEVLALWREAMPITANAFAGTLNERVPSAL